MAAVFPLRLSLWAKDPGFTASDLPLEKRQLHPDSGQGRFLSYQPPGNGWNNQRIALETALVLAKMLNRTLITHPLAPHAQGEVMKSYLPAGSRFGYLSYNRLDSSDLLPLSAFLDLRLMSELVPVVEVNSSHPQFLLDHSQLSWRNVCHSLGFGFWLDQHPRTARDVAVAIRQEFSPSKVWKKKCIQEQDAAKSTKLPIIKYVSDLANESSQMIYFPEGTLFGIQVRFLSLQNALLAQDWVLQYVKYSSNIYQLAAAVGERLGPYNAMHVRRVGHKDKRLSQVDWLRDMTDWEFSPDLPVYVATDDSDLEWFFPISAAGYQVVFASNFTDILNFTHYSESLWQDVLGIHEQVICEQAVKFIPSLSSTFSALIRRNRKEVAMRDGLFTETLHTSWINHTMT